MYILEIYILLMAMKARSLNRKWIQQNHIVHSPDDNCERLANIVRAVLPSGPWTLVLTSYSKNAAVN